MTIRNLKRNTTLNLLNIVINTVISFATRSFLIRYLGLEILGVNATIVETINMLNVTELGIQAAISYKMYAPIQKGDYKRQQQLFSLYRKAYRVVAIIILVTGLCLMPFLKTIVNTSISMRVVYAVYILQLGYTSLGYALSYYKLLYLTHEKQYITTRIDIIVTIVARIIQMIVLFLTKNYILYVACNYIICICVNLIIKKMSSKEYSEIIKSVVIEKKDVVQLFDELKQMMVGTFMSYINGSTDNIMSSALFGSLFTGFISNYKTITNIMKSFLSSLVLSLTPTWGTYLYSSTTDEESLNDHLNLSIYTFFVILLTLMIPTICLIDDFIVMWIGAEYIINPVIKLLIIIEIFCAFLNEPSRLITNNYGMFKEEKNISLVATVFNLLFSFLLSKVIGTPGVFIGTLISTLICWCLRSVVINKRCFSNGTDKLREYWFNNIIYLVSFFALYIVCNAISHLFVLHNSIMQFVIRGLIIETIIVIYLIIFWRKDKKFVFVIDKLRIDGFVERMKHTIVK